MIARCSSILQPFAVLLLIRSASGAHPDNDKLHFRSTPEPRSPTTSLADATLLLLLPPLNRHRRRLQTNPTCDGTVNVPGDQTRDPLTLTNCSSLSPGCVISRTCRYGASEGYYRVVNQDARCVLDAPGGTTASWSSAMPSCEEIKCDSIQFTGSGTTGPITVSQSCSAGSGGGLNLKVGCAISRTCQGEGSTRAVSTPSTITCALDATIPGGMNASWTGPPIHCETLCGALKVQKGTGPGSVLDVVTFNDRCASSKWRSRRTGTMTPNAEPCRVTRTCRAGSVASFSSSSAPVNATSNMTISCEVNAADGLGVWVFTGALAPGLPTCYRTNCPLTTSEESMAMHMLVLTDNGNETVECDQGYHLVPDAATGLVDHVPRVCVWKDETWQFDKPLPTCVESTCPSFSVENANYTTTYSDGLDHNTNATHLATVEASIACNAGYGYGDNGAPFAYCKEKSDFEGRVAVGGPSAWRLVGGVHIGCTGCGPGTVSKGSRCIPCIDGSFSGALADTCWPCPTRGATCLRGQLTLTRGMWFEGAFREDTFVYTCKPHRCLVSSDGAQLVCAPGNTGILCASCAENFATVGTRCVECVTQTAAFALSIVLLSVVAAVIVWIAWLRIASARNRSRGGRRSLVGSIQRVLLTFVQTMAILSASSIQPPDEVADIFATTSSFADGVSASAFPVQCLLRWGFYERCLFYMLAPLVVILVAFALILPARIIWKHLVRCCVMRRALAEDTKAGFAAEIERKAAVVIQKIGRRVSAMDLPSADALQVRVLVRASAVKPGAAAPGAAPQRRTSVAPRASASRPPPGRISLAVYSKRFERTKSNLSDLRATANAGGGTLSLEELRAILPPGLAAKDVGRLMVQFGTEIETDAEEEEEEDSLPTRSPQHGQANLFDFVEADAPHWRRHVEMRSGLVFYVNETTLERADELPKGGRVAKDLVDDTHASGHHIDAKGFAQLMRHLENENVVVAVLTSLVVVIYFVYFRITRSLIEVFTVTTINGKAYIAAAMENEAYTTSAHQLTMAFAALWIVLFTIGAPLVGFGLLIAQHSTGREADPRWRTAIGFLSDGYKRKFYWWEGVVLLRKLALLFVAAASANNGFLQSFLAVIILGVAIVLQFIVQPYEFALINVLDGVAMMTIYATRLGAMLYAFYDPDEVPAKRACAGNFDLGCRATRIALGGCVSYILIALQIGFILLFAVTLLKEKAEEILRAVRDRIAKKRTNAANRSELGGERDTSTVAKRSNPLTPRGRSSALSRTIAPNGGEVELAAIQPPHQQRGSLAATADNATLGSWHAPMGSLGTLDESCEEDVLHGVEEEEGCGGSLEAQPDQLWVFVDYEEVVHGKFSAAELVGWYWENQLHPETRVAPADMSVVEEEEEGGEEAPAGEWITLEALVALLGGGGGVRCRD